MSYVIIGMTWLVMACFFINFVAMIWRALSNPEQTIINLFDTTPEEDQQAEEDIFHHRL